MVPSSPNAAAQAHQNRARNTAALAATQPWLADRLDVPATIAEWVIARDGTLTGRDHAGQWHGGCSVPRAAAETMVTSLDVTGTLGCLLAPFHASAVRIVLDRLKLEQGLLCIVPDAQALAVLIHCIDFADDIAAHRLWLAGGATWAQDVDRILADHPGLPVPSRFIRLNDGLEQQAEAMVPPAQRIFSDHVHRRGARLAALQGERAITPRRPACVLAPSRFRLWDDAGHVLLALARDLDWPVLDADDPASASPLALTDRMSDCGALITVNRWRQDRSGAVPQDVPWITWLTVPHIPPFATAGRRDQLLLADPHWVRLAIAQGWPIDRVHVARWPGLDLTPPASDEPAVTMIHNLPSLEPPAQVRDMSSQRLLWEYIRDELLSDPFRLGDDVRGYLQTLISRGGIAPETLDSALFVDQLIVPAFAAGLAIILARENMPLRLYGSGWDQCEPLRPHVRGPVRTREAFTAAVRAASVLVHTWPLRDAHPIDAVGRPVVRALGTRVEVVAAVRRHLQQPQIAWPGGEPLSADLLRRIVGA